MAGGLVGTGRAYKQQAMAGLTRSADLQTRRLQAEEGLKQQADQFEQQQQMSAVGMGAGMGAMMAGATAGGVGGPVGALAGAAIGFLATELF